LDCASPLALWILRRCAAEAVVAPERKRQPTAALQNLADDPAVHESRRVQLHKDSGAHSAEPGSPEARKISFGAGDYDYDLGWD
jgi:hypothetical protein